MRFPRLWLALLLAGGHGMISAQAQDLPTSSGSDTTGASSSSGTTAPSAGTGTGTTPPSNPFGPATPAPPAPTYGFGPAPSDVGAASSFGAPTQPSTFGFGSTPPPASSTAPTPPSTSSPTTFGTSPSSVSGGLETSPGGTARVPSGPPPAVFNIPSFYGQAPQTFVGGQGRLARPHFTYSAGTSMGYDDNVNSTPFDAISTPEVTEKVLVSPAIPTITFPLFIQTGRIPIAQRNRTFIQIVIPGQKAVYKTVVVSPAVPAPQAIGSFVARANGNAQVQFSSRRSVFTMDAGVSASYFTNRPGDSSDLNGNVSLIYLRRFTPRLSFNANIAISYQSQPNIALVNGPATNQGDFLNTNSKFDLNYRWSPRFSTVSSLSYNSQIFTQNTASGQSFQEFILGTEGRWIWNPRLTLTGELRYSTDIHPNLSSLDSNSIFLLAGGELTLTRRIFASARLGIEARTFTETGDLSIAPYGETTLTYKYSRAGQVVWTSRIGFEEPPAPNTTTTVLRSGISVVQAFSTRTRGTVGLSAAHSVTSGNGVTSVLNSFQVNLSLAYMLNRHASLTANYDFNNSLSSVKGSSFVHNQLFLGLQYNF